MGKWIGRATEGGIDYWRGHRLDLLLKAYTSALASVPLPRSIADADGNADCIRTPGGCG